jgi:hypothetical protein
MKSEISHRIEMCAFLPSLYPLTYQQEEHEDTMSSEEQKLIYRVQSAFEICVLFDLKEAQDRFPVANVPQDFFLTTPIPEGGFKTDEIITSFGHFVVPRKCEAKSLQELFSSFEKTAYGEYDARCLVAMNEFSDFVKSGTLSPMIDGSVLVFVLSLFSFLGYTSEKIKKIALNTFDSAPEGEAKFSRRFIENAY